MEYEYLSTKSLDIDGLMPYEEITKIKEVLMSPNSIKEINFYNLSAEGLEYFKYLIELSPFIKDELVVKNVFGNIGSFTINDKYLNPDTWNLSFKEENDVTYLEKLRYHKNSWTKIRNIMHKLMLEDASNLEIVKVFYDEVKKLTKDKSCSELESIATGKTEDHNKIFNFLLNQIGYSSVIGDDGNVLVKIDDDKYNLSGTYLFSPKDDYSNDKYNLINYEYFAVNPDEFSSDFIDSFKIRDINYLKQNYKKFTALPYEIYFKLYKDIFMTKSFDEELKLKCITSFNPVDERLDENYSSLVRLNYYKSKVSIKNNLK